MSRLLIIFLIILISGFSPPLFAEEDSWQSLISIALALCQEGQCRDAIPYAEQALQIAETTFGPEDEQTGDSLSVLAWIYHQDEDFEQATPLYEQALAVYEKTLKESDLSMIYVLHNLALTNKNQYNREKSTLYYERALEGMEKLQDPALLGRQADAYEDLADLYRFSDGEKEYEEMEEKGKKIRLSLNGVLKCKEVKKEGWYYKRASERWLGDDPTFKYVNFRDKIQVTHYGLEASGFLTTEEFVTHLKNLFREFKSVETVKVDGKSAKKITIQYEYPAYTGHHGEHVPHRFNYEEFVLLPLEKGFLVFNFDLNHITPIVMSFAPEEEMTSEWLKEVARLGKTWNKFLKSCVIK